MSVKVLLSLEVEDFNKMKSVFDAAENARTEAGITAEAYRNMDAPNNAWVISTASSKEAFVAFFVPISKRTYEKRRSHFTSNNHVFGIDLAAS